MVFGRQTFLVCPGLYAFARMLDGLLILSNTTKHDQTQSNSTKQGVQTVKCLVTKQCLLIEKVAAVQALC